MKEKLMLAGVHRIISAGYRLGNRKTGNSLGVTGWSTRASHMTARRKTVIPAYDQ